MTKTEARETIADCCRLAKDHIKNRRALAAAKQIDLSIYCLFDKPSVGESYTNRIQKVSDLYESTFGESYRKILGHAEVRP